MADFSVAGAGSGAATGAQIGAVAGGFGAIPGAIVGGIAGGFAGGGRERRRGDPFAAQFGRESIEAAMIARRRLAALSDPLLQGQLPFSLQAEINKIREAQMANVRAILPEEQKAALEPLAATGFLRSGRGAEQTRRVAERFGLRMTNIEAEQAEAEINRRLQAFQTGLSLLQAQAMVPEGAFAAIAPQPRRLTTGQQFLQAAAPLGDIAGQFAQQRELREQEQLKFIRQRQLLREFMPRQQQPESPVI